MDIFHFRTGWYLFSSGKFSLSKEMSWADFISIIELSVRQRQMAFASPNSFTISFFTINSLPSCSFMYMTILDLPITHCLKFISYWMWLPFYFDFTLQISVMWFHHTSSKHTAFPCVIASFKLLFCKNSKSFLLWSLVCGN